jgi:hypothetical protein
MRAYHRPADLSSHTENANKKGGASGDLEIKRQWQEEDLPLPQE